MYSRFMSSATHTQASIDKTKESYIHRRPGRGKREAHARGPCYGTALHACGRAIVALHGAAAIEAASGAATVARRRQSPPASAWSAKIVYNNDYILLLLSKNDKMTACKAWTPQKAPARGTGTAAGGRGYFQNRARGSGSEHDACTSPSPSVSKSDSIIINSAYYNLSLFFAQNSFG